MNIIASVCSSTLFFMLFVIGEEVVRKLWKKPLSRRDFKVKITMTIGIITTLLFFYIIRGEWLY